MNLTTIFTCFSPTSYRPFKTSFRGAVRETQTILSTPELPPVKVLSRSLIHELDQIEKAFVLVLDYAHRWFRYHHLFQRLLQRLLKRRFNQDSIDALHKRASGWFAENGLIDEAIQHALEGGDTAAAAQLVAQHRHDLMNQEE